MLVFILSADETDKIEALFHKYGNKLLYYIKKIVKDEHIAEDILHNIFIRIINNIDKLDDVDSVRTKNYLYTTANGAALTAYQKIKNHETCHKTLDESVTYIEDEFDVIESISNAVISERFDMCIKQLSENDREIIMLKYGSEYEDTDISKILGITNEAVRQRLSRARKRLATILAGRRGDGNV